MSKSATILVVVGVVGIGLLVGWLGTRSSKPLPAGPVEATGGSSSPESTQAARTAIFAPRNPNPVHSPGNEGLGGGKTLTPVPNTAASTGLITNWEEQVDQILTSDGVDSDKAKQMLEMFPRLSQEGQVEVAQHLSNLLPDEDYAPLGKYLVDPKLPEDVQDELMADILNRPNSVKLPYLMEVAKQPEHAKASEAKDLLELFLEEDYGSDWAKWQAKLDEWLKENPD